MDPIQKLQRKLSVVNTAPGHHDTQQNDNQHNDTQHTRFIRDTQHKLH
jgi:hypothetical protein